MKPHRPPFATATPTRSLSLPNRVRAYVETVGLPTTVAAMAGAMHASPEAIVQVLRCNPSVFVSERDGGHTFWRLRRDSDAPAWRVAPPINVQRRRPEPNWSMIGLALLVGAMWGGVALWITR